MDELQSPDQLLLHWFSFLSILAGMISVIWLWRFPKPLAIILVRVRIFWTGFVSLYIIAQTIIHLPLIIPQSIHSLNEKGIHNINFFLIFFYLNDFIFLGWLYCAIFKTKKAQFRITIINYTCILINVIDYIWIGDWRDYGIMNSLCDTVYCILLPSISLITLVRSNPMIPIIKDPQFLIQLGILVPNTLNLILFIISDHLFKNQFYTFMYIQIFTTGITMTSMITFFSLAFRHRQFASIFEGRVRVAVH